MEGTLHKDPPKKPPKGTQALSYRPLPRGIVLELIVLYQTPGPLQGEIPGPPLSVMHRLKGSRVQGLGFRVV